MSETLRDAPRTTRTSGPGRLLVAVYALFAVAATGRSTVQILTRFEEAPLAYSLSALAAAVYIVATVGIAGTGRASYRVALACCTTEFVGVVSVGLFTLLVPEAFPDDTVWSLFGMGYGFVPLVLPVLGLLWLRRSRPRAGEPAGNPANPG
ncbi:hypothetical protein NI17_022330 [Thermobifida halotolerans]|uniref:Uncharacterized protein n=1 Tax=Thermobifida halotolerans TaxID=483545 RepID=A0A399FZ01_9ACTN|nr:hypothetical protein [Thermobifida halotolerans]UOE19426.1 hypothetical protein NI17_022330 [Thermobifida halotolerans]